MRLFNKDTVFEFMQCSQFLYLKVTNKRVDREKVQISTVIIRRSITRLTSVNPS